MDLKSIECKNPAGVVETQPITLGPGEIHRCTVINHQKAKLTIDKVTKPAGSAASFKFTVAPGSIDFLTDTGAPLAWNLDPVGSYTIVETAPDAYWKLENDKPVCTTKLGSQVTAGATTTIVPVPGDEIFCTYTNVQNGDIFIGKTSVGGTDDFDFTAPSEWAATSQSRR